MISLLLLLLSVPVLLATVYVGVLTLLSASIKAPAAPSPRLRFVMLVPAHNESAGIVRTVENLLSVQWPRELMRVLVVADNCSDDTAALARMAGAQVLERQDAVERGKGYALRFAYEHLLAEGWADAVVVVDADTVVSANLLQAFAARLESGEQAAQAFYGVLNPLASWRTRLITIALAIFHRVRGRGRERLGVTSVLRGNGMCFSRDTLRRVPHRAFSLVEDLEYCIQLARAGVRVAYVDEAEVFGEMVSNEKAARSQRERWEGGRMQMAREHGLPLLRDAIAGRSRLLFDLACDVLVPPLGYIGLSAALLALIGGAAFALNAIGTGLLSLLLLPTVLVVLHVSRGVMLSGLGLRGWLDLAAAPFYVFWKILLMLRRRAGADWVRTEREKRPGA